MKPTNLEMKPTNLEIKPTNLEIKPTNLEMKPTNREMKPTKTRTTHQNFEQTEGVAERTQERNNWTTIINNIHPHIVLKEIQINPLIKTKTNPSDIRRMLKFKTN